METIKKVRTPETAKEMKYFLGFFGYDRRFITDFEKLTKPFTKCLRKGEKIKHYKEFIETSSELTIERSNNPISEFGTSFILITDASHFQ